MKKLLSLILAMLMLVMGTIVFAEVEDSREVLLGLAPVGGDAEPVISVDITWPDLNFTMDIESTQVWNPETLSYEYSDGRVSNLRADTTQTSQTNDFMVYSRSNCPLEVTCSVDVADVLEDEILAWVDFGLNLVLNSNSGTINETAEGRDANTLPSVGFGVKFELAEGVETLGEDELAYFGEENACVLGTVTISIGQYGASEPDDEGTDGE